MLTTEQIKQTVSEYFKDKPVKKVYLFGSYARGEADEKSDVDLLVELDYSQRVGLSFYGWYVDLGDIFSKKVDVVPADCIYEDLKIAIERDKILLVSTETPAA
ncbi:MAG TPA: nucleotidyltransferase domain-containing protein [Flavisolibacter sp.]|jgi:hypothetical protein